LRSKSFQNWSRQTFAKSSQRSGDIGRQKTGTTSKSSGNTCGKCRPCFQVVRQEAHHRRCRKHERSGKLKVEETSHLGGTAPSPFYEKAGKAKNGHERSDKRKDKDKPQISKHPCLNKECSEKHRIKECTNTSEDLKQQLLDEFYPNKLKNAGKTRQMLSF
jgi:hypothetical protein